MNTPIKNPVQEAIDEANRDRAEFSDIANARGAAGKEAKMTLLEREPILIRPQGAPVEIDLSWDHGQHGRGLIGGIKRLFGHGRVDLDLGCLYELKSGKKGCIQSFGHLFGALDKEPYIALSGDERSGAAPGADESLTINTEHWAEIDRVLVYAYIYNGLPDWGALRTECTLRHGTESPIFVSMEETEDHLPICALILLENDHSQMRISRRIEYFHGHPELDRAYGFGLNWEEGQKS